MNEFSRQEVSEKGDDSIFAVRLILDHLDESDYIQ